MEDLHKGHRERLRQRMLEDGLDRFESHQVLELLLFYAVPRKDTNELAHRLIRAFGSLSGVMDAPYEELLKVSRMGPVAASLLKLIPELARVYLCDQAQSGLVLDSTAKLGDYLRSRFVGRSNETVFLLCLDNTCKLLSCTMLSEGSLDQVPVIPRRVAEEAMRTKATAVVLAHNHPKGLAMPSKQDVVMTRSLCQNLQGVGIRLLDHMVVARDDYYSMADAGVLPSGSRYCAMADEGAASMDQAADPIWPGEDGSGEWGYFPEEH